MKEVLALIKKKKLEFAQVPLMKFLQDKSIDPRQRLPWGSAFAPFAMRFKDFNRSVLRKEPADSLLQEMINQHSYEDGRPWVWFLQYMKVMGCDNPIKYTDMLKFLWNEETQKVSKMAYDLFAILTFEEDILMKLVVVESIEAMGNVALYEIAQVAKELQEITKEHHPYFGESHYAKESGHIQAQMDDVEHFIESIELTEAQRKKALIVVEKVFADFTEAMDEMLVFAQKHLYDQSFREFVPKELKAKGFDTIGAQNGLIGIQRVQQNLPNLIISEIVMPWLGTVQELLEALIAQLEKQAPLKQLYAAQFRQIPESPCADTVTISVTENSSLPSLPKLKEVFDFIEANYHQPITLSDVAQAVGYSPTYLTSLVRCQTGKTVYGWIVERRMAQAHFLLLNTDQPVNRIAAAVGYPDAGHFIRQFRNLYNTTPKMWRNMHRS